MLSRQSQAAEYHTTKELFNNTIDLGERRLRG